MGLLDQLIQIIRPQPTSPPIGGSTDAEFQNWIKGKNIQTPEYEYQKAREMERLNKAQSGMISPVERITRNQIQEMLFRTRSSNPLLPNNY
jgi:hypothetical protein